jgi:hypothetical protein
MNGNVYKERDLIAAALSLKGKHPSLNHKDEFWFSPENPRNRWGTLTVEGGKYEDGAIEAILQVPKDAVCPICSGAKMTELIDSRRIVNVSLEGTCVGGVCYDGTCEGFTFNDPPFTLLTSDVLPGIPLARIKPLETIMVEALGAKTKSEQKMKKKAKRIKVKTEPKEDRHQNIRQPATSVNTRSMPDPFTGTWGTPITSDEQIDTPTDLTKTVMGVNPAGPEPVMRQGESRREDAKPPEHPAAPLTGPKKDTSTITPDMGLEPDKSKPPRLDVMLPPGTGDHLPKQEVPHVDAGTPPRKAKDGVALGTPTVEQDAPCPLGQHRDDFGNCVPDTQLSPGGECQPGFHKDADGYCVADDVEEQDDGDIGGTRATTPNTPLIPCEPGYHHNSQGICVPDEPVEQIPEPPCPAGWWEVNGHCVKAEPVEQTECGDGFHRNAEGECVADSDAEEQVRRIKAEYKAAGLARNLKYVENLWITKFTKLKEQNAGIVARKNRLEAIIKELRHSKQSVEAKLDTAQAAHGRRVQELQIELADFKERYGNSVREQSKTGQLVDDLKIENADLRSKYNGALKLNLTLSQKNTGANEDYLKLAKQCEELKAKLTRARTNAKKTLKIRA